MARNKKGGLQYGAQILAGAAIMYFLLDFPIRFTQAYDFPVCIGIKSYLPFTLGLFFGLPGILGGVLGAILGFVFAQVVSVNVFGSSITFQPLLLPVTVLVSVIIAAVSCLMPIKRAVAIDPAIVLKGE